MANLYVLSQLYENTRILHFCPSLADYKINDKIVTVTIDSDTSKFEVR